MKKLLIVTFIFLGFFLFPSLSRADTVQCNATVIGGCGGDANCIDAGDGTCACNFSITCDRPSPLCCRTSGGCQWGDEVASQWSYFTNFTCKNAVYNVDRGRGFGECDFNFDRCAAVDHCTQPDPLLQAGRCEESGCAVGGTYKTCCTGNTTSSNSCVITKPSVVPNGGVCPSDTTKVVLCGPEFGVPCGAAACGPTPTPTPAPIGCKTDAASAVGCEKGCKVVNNVKLYCNLYNRNLQNVCDTQCPAPVGVAEWNCVRNDTLCPQPPTTTPAPTPCSGPNCCYTPGATRPDCRPATQCSL